MNWLIAYSEILAGISLFLGGVGLVAILRPSEGLQEKRIVSFPGAWIIVGLLLTILFSMAIALIALGLGILK